MGLFFAIGEKYKESMGVGVYTIIPHYRGDLNTRTI
jgi:hypothetical protein